ncbi:MAG: peptide deformylase [Bacteroidia bacterium]|nr:peptide deformylase [Bacteroidia bacterium]
MKKIILGILLLCGGGIFAQGGFDLNKPNIPYTNYWSEEDSALIKGEPKDPMRVFLITRYNDSLLLRKQSGYVVPTPDDPMLKLFIDRLYATVTDSASLGVGIAAPQVGLLRNIIWVQRFDKEGFPFEVYLNPVIRQYSKLPREGREGCLSIPVTRDTVSRAYAILIEYDDPNGGHHIEMVEDFTAVIFQHEIDHLNGIVFTDHVKQEMEDAKKKEEANKD